MWGVFYVFFAADAVVDLVYEACLIDYRAGVVGAAHRDTFFDFVLFLMFEDRMA